MSVLGSRGSTDDNTCNAKRNNRNHKLGFVSKMKTYRKFIRAKKGMSTIFGAVFFIILILMGFNILVWSFIQNDAYNIVATSMRLRDQQANAENLAPVAPGATPINSNSFNIIVNNLGGAAVTITRIYIVNVSPTNSAQCSGTGPCIVDPNPGTSNCAGNGICYFTNANIRAGENNHNIPVTGLAINDGSGYAVGLATTRGRLFSFSYPWPVPPTNSTQHGALDVKFDVNSFNFTRGSQTVSQPAWTLPIQQNVVFWVKITNNAPSPITLNQHTAIDFLCFATPTKSCKNIANDYYIVDNSTLNPNAITAYNAATNPYVLPAATANGPTGFTLVKFGTNSPGTATAQDIENEADMFVVMGFYYQINGVTVGQTIPFVAVLTCKTWPSCP